MAHRGRAAGPLTDRKANRDGCGRARTGAIDGDTLEIEGLRVRLHGIDAPESAQTCGRPGGRGWPCGLKAQEALEVLVAGHHVTCTGADHDSYGRMLAVCRAAGRELNAEMVRLGLAWAFVSYSRQYVALEAEARQRLAGMWQGPAEPPWSFRARR